LKKLLVRDEPSSNKLTLDFEEFTNLNQVIFPFSSQITLDVKNKENKLSLIKDLLIHDKMFISENCKKMIWEMTNYRKDENGKIPKKDDHLIDALRYGLNAAHYDFNPNDKPKEVEDTRRGRALTYDYAMSEDRELEYDYGNYELEEEYDY
jgi:hypothetical protein